MVSILLISDGDGTFVQIDNGNTFQSDVDSECQEPQCMVHVLKKVTTVVIYIDYIMCCVFLSSNMISQ